jgi:predicted Zn-dependent protease
LGKFDDATADYTRFVALRPGNTDLLVGRAESFRRGGKLGQALADATTAQDTAPKWEAPQIELGEVYLSKGDLTNALASFEAATKLAPRDATAFELKGQVEWAMGRFDDAIDSFKDSLEQNELQEDAFVWLSMARGRKGDKPDTRTAERFAKANLSAWPGPMVQLYLGKSTPQDTLKMADLYHLRCNADFLVGEWYATQGNTSAAKTALQQTTQSCRPGSLFLKFAAIDLGRLP